MLRRRGDAAVARRAHDRRASCSSGSPSAPGSTRRPGIWRQRLVGLLTWTLLIAILRRQPRSVRVQVAVVIVIATCVEYTASPLLGLYTYRLHNVPSYVPPGHGLVYLAALNIGRSALAARLRLPLLGFALVVCGAWAVWGAAFAPRQDMLGAGDVPVPRPVHPRRPPAARLRGRVPRVQLPGADRHRRGGVAVGDCTIPPGCSRSATRRAASPAATASWTRSASRMAPRVLAWIDRRPPVLAWLRPLPDDAG